MKYSSDIVSVVQSGRDTNILRILREQTATLVVMVQVLNEERKTITAHAAVQEEIEDEPPALF